MFATSVDSDVKRVKRMARDDGPVDVQLCAHTPSYTVVRRQGHNQSEAKLAFQRTAELHPSHLCWTAVGAWRGGEVDSTNKSCDQDRTVAPCALYPVQKPLDQDQTVPRSAEQQTPSS